MINGKSCAPGFQHVEQRSLAGGEGGLPDGEELLVMREEDLFAVIESK